MLQVGKVPETLRVREHIDLFSSYYPNPMPLQEVLAAAGLEKLRDRKFGDLSGGQRQRTLFALAICGNPDLLFLDEPTVGLDVEARRALWEEIRRLVERGKTVLLTTHYLEEADALADRIAVINQGEIIAEGTPAEIKAQTSGKRIRCITALSLACFAANSRRDRCEAGSRSGRDPYPRGRVGGSHLAGARPLALRTGDHQRGTRRSISGPYSGQRRKRKSARTDSLFFPAPQTQDKRPRKRS